MQHAYHLGIDLHKAFSYWTLINNDRDVLFQGKVTTSEEDTLAALGRLPVPANEIQPPSRRYRSGAGTRKSWSKKE